MKITLLNPFLFSPRLELTEDALDDDKPANVALAAEADYLPTNDRHFEVLQQLAFLRVPAVSL